MPRDASVLKIQRESCHPKCARKVSGLSRNGSLIAGNDNRSLLMLGLSLLFYFICNGLLRSRWGELLRKMHVWVEIHEINDQGVYAPVELHIQKDNLTGGVFQLRQGHSRRIVVHVQPVYRAGSLPVVCNMISAVFIGSVCMRTKSQQPLDSYQEKDLAM